MGSSVERLQKDWSRKKGMCWITTLHRVCIMWYLGVIYVVYAYIVEVVKVKVKVTLRPTVSRPVRIGVRRPPGTRDQFFFPLEIFFRQFRVCYFVAPSLTRGWVCNLLLLLLLASAVPLGSVPLWWEVGSVFCQYQSIVSMYMYLHKIFALSVFDTVQGCSLYTIHTRPLSVQALYSRLCPSY
jgi:hypothetical protein